MKKLLTLLFFVTVLSTSAFSQLKFGAGAGLILDGTLFGVGGRGHYTINEDFAGQGTFTYYFEDVSVWTLDLDVHYSGFNLGDVESFRLTPFAGLNIFRASVLGFGATDTGINLGLNGTMPLTGSLDLYVEPKIIIGGGSSIAIAAGVYF
jgi:hypothetical protein